MFCEFFDVHVYLEFFLKKTVDKKELEDLGNNLEDFG